MVDWMNSGDTLWRRDLLVSFIFLLSVFLVRRVLARVVVHVDGLSLETRRRWMVSVRNGMLLIALLGLILIWAPEIRTLALSLVAVAAAIVIATKDLILCFSGGVWRAASQAYKVGDRIKIGEIRGDVVDINFMATTVMELGPGLEAHQYTGRAVVFPNSLLLSEPVADESYTGAYRMRIMRVPIKLPEDWRHAERLLLDIAFKECGDYLEAARTHMDKMRHDEGFDTPTVEPRVLVELPDPERVDLLLRVAVPAGREGRITQAILHRFLAEFYHPTPVNAADAPSR